MLHALRGVNKDIQYVSYARYTSAWEKDEQQEEHNKQKKYVDTAHLKIVLSTTLNASVPCFQSLQSRRFEARRCLAESTSRTQNVLAQGQSDAYGDSKLYNTIVEVPARLNLKKMATVLPC